MSRVNLNVSVRLVRFPRVSGDEPHIEQSDLLDNVVFPA